MTPAPIAVALDAPDLETAARWASLVTPHVSTVKVGLELYLRYGPDVIASVRGASGVQVFLDLKLHDIPNTVAGATKAVARLKPAFLTVHASGGAAMDPGGRRGGPPDAHRGRHGAHLALGGRPGRHRAPGAASGRRTPSRRPRGGGGGPGARLLAHGGRGRPRGGGGGHHAHHPRRPPGGGRLAGPGTRRDTRESACRRRRPPRDRPPDHRLGGPRSERRGHRRGIEAHITVPPLMRPFSSTHS